MYKYMSAALDEQIKKVCPIDGISIGNERRKDTWSIQFSEEATIDQRRAAFQVLDSFVWDEKKEAEVDKVERILDLKKQLPMRGGYIIYKDTHPKATFEEYVKYLDEIEIQ